MKKDQLTVTKGTEKKSVSKNLTPTNYKHQPVNQLDEILITLPLSRINPDLTRLIQFEFISNEYILAITGLFSNECPDILVNIQDALTSIYSIPNEGEEISDLFDKYRPSDILNLENSSLIIEKELYTKHLNTVKPDESCLMVFTKQTIIDLIIAAGTVTYVDRGISKIQLFDATLPAFEGEGLVGNIFNTDHVSQLLFKVLKSTEDDEHHMMYNIFNQVNPRLPKSKLREQVSEQLDTFLKLVSAKPLN